MRIRTVVALMATVASLALLSASGSGLSQATPVRSYAVHGGYDLPPMADAGPDFITYVGLSTNFRGRGAALDDEIARYEWDFDGDGAYDFQSLETGLASHVYHSAGTYSATLRVSETQGNVAIDAVRVIVKVGMGEQEYLPTVRVEPDRAPSVVTQGDGVVERYAVMINGGSETRFWSDVTFMYSTLTGDYSIPPNHIYLFNHDGTDPDGTNPDGMIDYPATLSNIDAVFTDLSTIIDDDDELFVWVTDHGRGYCGPRLQSYGYLAGDASVDPGDEPDYLESDFKLRSLCTYGDYAEPYYNHGMNELKVCRRYLSSQGAYEMYRNMFVSTFTDVYFESSGIQSDDDIYIERLVDYLSGDTDRDGYVETAEGEVFDYDGDGNPPYDHATGIFDEDDWGDWDHYVDNFNHINSGCPGDSYIIFDHGFDNHVDIDINYDPGNLEVDGTDLDNQGLFDGIDVNEDGDMDDWVSIDEKICLHGGADMLDDEMAVFLDRIDANVISIFMEQCFSGGFIDDLSASDRVISTATEEETMSWGNLFVELFTSAFHRATPYGEAVDADHDQNGHISMREAFNYAAEHDYYDETPQYDDNGDGTGHPQPIPQGGDGSLGAVTYLESFHGLTVTPVTHAQLGDPGVAVTHTLQVTNTGSVVDTFDVSVGGYSWTTAVDPATVGPLVPGSSAGVTVTVTVPTSASGGATDVAVATVTSRGDGMVTTTSTLTTTANNVYGLMVTPASDTRSGDPGATVTYTLQVTNTGNTSDTFDVGVGGYSWATVVDPPAVGPLVPGGSADVTVMVTVPTSAAGGTTDEAVATVTSRGDGLRIATCTLTTTARSHRIFLPLTIV